MQQEGNRRIEVRSGPLGQSVWAVAPIPEGDVVVSGWGPRLPGRTRHSFQVGPDVHVEIRNEVELINHSCEPNCGVYLPAGAERLEVVARRPLAPGEEVTIDYAMFEYAVEFMPERCLCGSPVCRGRVTGYRDLPVEQRAAYGRFIAAHLHALDALVAEPA